MPDLCKQAHYHVRMANGQLRWRRYYSPDWAMQVARAYGGEAIGTYSHAAQCNGCQEIADIQAERPRPALRLVK